LVKKDIADWLWEVAILEPRIAQSKPAGRRISQRKIHGERREIFFFSRSCYQASTCLLEHDVEDPQGMTKAGCRVNWPVSGWIEADGMIVVGHWGAGFRVGRPTGRKAGGKEKRETETRRTRRENVMHASDISNP
jgi:hypothetical protein